MAQCRVPIVHVALAVIKRRGRYLICRRRDKAVFGGYWEFPGGKRELGEAWEACVRREVREELGVSIRAPEPLTTFLYHYPRRTIYFRVFRCAIARGRPRPLGAQAVHWVRPEQLSACRFPPANAQLTKRLAAVG